jgi:predicted glycosyltransferase
MKIVFYCQYVFGMGHLFRSIELLRAFNRDTVTLVAGGLEVDAEPPPHVRLVRLPALYMDERFTTLLPGEPGQSVAQIQQQRQDRLLSLVDERRPDLFVTELYPFGRSFFEFELLPLLESIRSGRLGAVQAVCSLRDVLVEKRDPDQFEHRVLDRLNRFYDLLLIHSDPCVLRLEETFRRTAEIRVPIHYTGFVARPPTGPGRSAMRAALGLDPQELLVVASAGGGRSGFPLLKSVVLACRRINDGGTLRIRLLVFAGPFMEEADFARLQEASGPGITVRRFSRRFVAYLNAADLSVSLAGYNTCMNLLATGVPALVHPYPRQQEQPMRVAKLKTIAPIRSLAVADIDPQRLRCHIVDMLQRPPERRRPNVDMNGARHACRFLHQWMPLPAGTRPL